MPSVKGLPRLIAVVQLALQGAHPNLDPAGKSVMTAQAAGLTGAEIDAAAQGRSFDFSANAAIALAMAISSKDPSEIARARQQAWSSGLSSLDVLSIEEATRRMLKRAARP